MRSISYLIIVLIAAGCSRSESKSDVSLAAFNQAGAPTVQFSVPDMMCVEGCAVAVKEILAKQPGVKDVLVDFDAKTATVAVVEGTFDAAKALAALVDKRFDNSSLTEPALVSPSSETGSAAY